MKKIVLLIICFHLFSCGVKAPPIAPVRPADSETSEKLNCSPTEPDCDATDPDYIPRKK